MFRIKSVSPTPPSNQSYLSIRLNHPPDHVFALGDLIDGAVVLTSFKAIENPTVTISFTGKVQTTIGTTESIRKHKQELFEFPQIIFQNSDSLPASTYSWPFNFTFPSHFTVHQCHKFHASDKFDLHSGEGHQPLPPTFLCQGDGGTGIVAYKLKATIPGRTFSLKDKVPITFASTRSISKSGMINSGSEVQRTYRIGKDGKPRYETAWEKMKKNPPDRKSIKPLILLDYPSNIILGDSYPVTLRINTSTSVKGPEKEKSDRKLFSEKQIEPTFTLKKLTATLTIETNIRVPGPKSEDFLNVKEIRKIEDTSNSGNKVIFNARNVFNGVTFKGDLAPTFRSFSIGVSYSLNIRVEMDMMGREQNLFVNALQIPVLGSRYRKEGVEVMVGGGGEENPPTYSQS